jgi:hypothetical protein
MKRRRKTLSGTQAQHTERQAVHLKTVGRLVEGAERALRDGNCTGATKLLLPAASAWGAYNAEKDWSETSTVGENRKSNYYFAVREEYMDRCVVGEGRR